MGHPNNQKRTISETCKVVTESLPELLDSAPSTLQYNQESGKDLGTTIVKIEHSDSALTLLADLIKSSQERNSPEEQNNSSSDDHIPNSKSLQKCEKQFSHDVNFKTQQAHHSQGQETVHVCHYCQKEFQHLGHYKEHLRKHTDWVLLKCRTRNTCSLFGSIGESSPSPPPPSLQGRCGGAERLRGGLIFYFCAHDLIVGTTNTYTKFSGDLK
uniref:C2H2-type domain-containing protein n=1 Tax=Eptatretus burgeri TaxID=7764 RepID=A0A8C4WWU7_EPTBU